MTIKKLILILAAAAAGPAAQGELLGKWTFDARSLANSGAAGAVHDGAAEGDVRYCEDTRTGAGYALNLSADGAFLRIMNSAAGERNYSSTFDAPVSFSYSFWIRRPAGSASWVRWNEFGGKGCESEERGFRGWSVRQRDIGEGSRVDLYQKNNGYVASAAGSVEVLDGKWHMLTFTYDAAAKRLAYYVDGKPAGSALDAEMHSAPECPLVFGARGLAGKEQMRGSRILLDDVLFYNRALSASEVAGLAVLNNSLGLVL